MDKTWFYAKSGSNQREGPVAESEVRTLIQTGALGDADMAWCEGMANWAHLRDMPELLPGSAPAAAAQGGSPVMARGQTPIREEKHLSAFAQADPKIPHFVRVYVAALPAL